MIKLPPPKRGDSVVWKSVNSLHWPRSRQDYERKQGADIANLWGSHVELSCREYSVLHCTTCSLIEISFCHVKGFALFRACPYGSVRVYYKFSVYTKHQDQHFLDTVMYYGGADEVCPSTLFSTSVLLGMDFIRLQTCVLHWLPVVCDNHSRDVNHTKKLIPNDPSYGTIPCPAQQER